MRKEGLILGGIGLVTLLIVIGAALMLSGPSTPSSNAASSGQVTDTALLRGPANARNEVGSSSAKVTIVEFRRFPMSSLWGSPSSSKANLK